jgi:hypothetical protein
MIVAKRYISVATEALQGIPWPHLHFREIHDSVGPARLEFAMYWREGNENPALKHFFKLVAICHYFSPINVLPMVRLSNVFTIIEEICVEIGSK